MADEEERDEASGEETSENEDTGSDETEGGEGGEGEASESGAEASDDGDGDGDEGEGEEPQAEGDEPAEAPAPAAAKAVTGKKKGGRNSAGARLAAAKAAKAAKKAVKKAQIAAEQEAASSPSSTTSSAEPEPEPLEQLKESAIGRAATQAGDWASANQALATGLAAAIVLGLAGWIGWNWYTGSQAEAAGALLAEAVEIANADIVDEEDAEADTESDTPTFTSATARAEAAVEAYRAVVAQYPGSRAAGWARLGEARALAETGDADGARDAYAAAIREHGDDPIVALRAYEGAGFTYEAEEDWEHAREEYEHIAGLADGAYAVVGRYHLARMDIATGDRVAAQTALEELIDDIESDTDGPESPFPYVLAQAQARLRELDPSSAGGSESPITLGGGGGLPEGITPEMLEALRRAMGGGE